MESRADYSKFLEFGTAKMRARPFMFPALEKNRNKIRRMLKASERESIMALHTTEVQKSIFLHFLEIQHLMD